MKKFIPILLLILIFQASWVDSYSNGVKVKITPAYQVLSTFDPITLQVEVEGVTDLFAASITVSYDNTVLTLTSRSNGSFLENNPNGSTVYYDELPEIADALDSIIVDAAILGVSGSSGSGILFKLTFSPFRADTAVIKIVSLSLRNSNNQEITAITDTAVVIFLATQANVKIFLEGPYSGGSMLTGLNDHDLLPLNHPYNTAPWNYSGIDQVSPNFFDSHPDIVDWVLIELRTGTASSTLVGRRAALLTSEGFIVDIDGESTVTFFVPPDAAYYIVIKHRNHLTIMSSTSVLLGTSGSSSFYNFTTYQNKAYGTNAMKQLGIGIFGLFTGDANSDGRLNATDRALIWNERNLIEYINEDITLDAIVNATDRAIAWNNRNLRTQIP